MLEREGKEGSIIFFSMLRISASAFGGGFAIASFIRREFMEKRIWIDENEMLDLLSIGQTAPGAVAVNVSFLVGYKTLGLPGAILALIERSPSLFRSPNCLLHI